MNARIKQGIRPLVSAFGITLLAILAPRLFWTMEPATMIAFTLCACLFGCTILSSMVFGLEFQHRTLPLLLVQPVPRRTIWREKHLVLGIGLMILLAITALDIHFLKSRALDKDANHVLWFILSIGCLGAFAAMPFFVFAGRKILIAIAYYTIFPLVLLLAMLFAVWISVRLGFNGVAKALDDHEIFFPVAGSLLYCAVMYWLGRRTFMRLEVKEGEPGEIKLPESISQRLRQLANLFLPRYQKPAASLMRKELELQQGCLLLGSSVILLFFIALLAGKLFGWSQENLEILRTLSMEIPMLIIPLISGLTSVAEERMRGQFVFQRMLPVSTAKQWMIKLAVALGVGIIIGDLLPLLIYAIPLGLDSALTHSGIRSLCLIGLALFCISFYVSSLTTNISGAILVATAAFVLIPAAVFYSAAFTVQAHNHLFPMSPRALGDPNQLQTSFLSMLLSAGILTMLSLFIPAYLNFKLVEITRRRVIGQLILILLCAAMIAMICASIGIAFDKGATLIN